MVQQTAARAAVDSERLLTQMIGIRRFEEAALEHYRAGRVPGPLHLSLGQEAVAVGVCAALDEDDVVISTHRGHHHCLAKGAPPERMMAEILGRVDGWARGRGGSMHLIAPEFGVLGTNGIVGGGIPIAVGAAYAFMAAAQLRVSVCFFGEGAAATGAFGEALNLAALWKLPLVFVCENNQHVEFGRIEDHIAGEIVSRGDSYGIPGVRVDGNDVEATQEAALEAVNRARGGGGPTLIEALTFRWSGHHVDDVASGTTQEELNDWIEGRDPIARFKLICGPEASTRAETRAMEQVEAATRFALASPAADETTLVLDHVGVS